MGKKHNFNRDYYNMRNESPEALAEREAQKEQRLMEEQTRQALRRSREETTHPPHVPQKNIQE